MHTELDSVAGGLNSYQRCICLILSLSPYKELLDKI